MQGRTEWALSMQEVSGIQNSPAQLQWQLQLQKPVLLNQALTIEAAHLAQQDLPQQASIDTPSRAMGWR